MSNADVNMIAAVGDTLGRRAWRRLKASPLTLMCFGIVGAYLFVALLGYTGLVADFQQKVGEKFLAPSFTKPALWLGTDIFGRSVLFKLFAGARTAMTLGIIVTSITLPLGLFMGAISGYFGGKIDMVVQWIYSVVVAVPSILLIIAISYILGKGLLAICKRVLQFGDIKAQDLMTPRTKIIGIRRSSCQRLEKFFRLPEEPQAKGVPSVVSLLRNSPAIGPGITIRGLSLQLGERGILNDIDFEAKPGEFVAIIGEVGSGKTQFLLSLLRDSPAVFDTFRIDDLDATRLSLPELRDLFSYVPQDGFTMSTTLRDNVAFAYDFAPDYDSEISESLRLAYFEPEQERMSGRLETEIGERGVNLSGGQRQRVGLARAYLHQRSIVLLDDTFSAVDVETEQKLIERLVLGKWKQHTRILVTHRLSVLEHADRVYIMERGRLRLRE